MPHPRRALGRIRTGDAHLRKVALYPLSYRGVCRLVAGASQLVSRFDGIYIIFSLVVMGCDFHGFRYLDDGFYMRSTWPF